MAYRNHHRLPGWLLLAACALMPVAMVRAQALYQQCPELTAGAEAEVTRRLAALKDKDPKARAEAARQLSKTCDPRVTEPLTALLKDAEPLVRVAAVEALGQLGDRAAVEPLIAAIKDEDWRVRLALGRSLCSFQYYQASYAALNELANPQDAKVTDPNDLRARCVALVAVLRLNDVRFGRKAVSLLFEFLDSEEPTLRQIAEQAMTELKQTRNGPPELIAILKQHNSPAFRRKAAYWLGQLGIERSRAALAEASIGDRDQRVRDTAAEALALLKGSSGQ
jgi:HEAT repeat protein